ncbi:MAG: ATP phosphoribosyltransferase regulatory subunit [Lachnospiraceae bacterium]|jgi:ATP phosphoribosyltransferase regulatory subunit|nr:ATP phosphoribosyltransferase regulatory subunit [Lachnospiraceae bacterium]
MKNQLLHTPEGVRDIYNEECERKLVLQEKLHHVLKQYGYQDIQTPMFEFFDVFGKERGSVISKEMYKFFDREGNTLVLRPDITPSIARSAAKYYMDEEMPLRFCYIGNTFINNSSYQGRMKECTQLGCELIGDETADADGEMIAVIIRCLLASGLTEFQVELGEADFFRGLIEEADIEEEIEWKLRELIENKNYFGVEELLEGENISKEKIATFLKLQELFGSVEKLSQARALTENKLAQKAIERLEKIYHILELYGLEKYISFELGMLGRYKYYTGILFKGYTYGTGDMIVTGGRYNNLLKQFGKDAPSIGFAINLDQLLLALSRQKIKVPIKEDTILVLYELEDRKQGILLAEQLRGEEKKVVLLRKHVGNNWEDYLEYAKKNGIHTVYEVKNGKVEEKNF